MRSKFRYKRHNNHKQDSNANYPSYNRIKCAEKSGNAMGLPPGTNRSNGVENGELSIIAVINLLLRLDCSEQLMLMHPSIGEQSV